MKLTTEEAHRAIVRYIQQHPEKTYIEVGALFGYSSVRISQIATMYKLPRRWGRKRSRVTTDLVERLEGRVKPVPAPEPIWSTGAGFVDKVGR